jgi:hypothetical protein
MKLNVKNLSYILVIINSLILFGEVPGAILGLTCFLIVLSLFIKNDIAKNIIKTTFLFGSLFLIKHLFKTFLVTEAGVSFVLILASLKLWEMENESDFFNMFLILALLESCLFLLSPTFLTFFLGLIKIIVFFYFILKIRNYDLSLLNSKRLLILIAPSLVFSLVLFYTFPRFTSGFLNASNQQLLFSGVDSQMNFKNLGPLNLSSKKVFKVFGLKAANFPIPLLYWRENVLWDYHKAEWKTGYLNLRAEQIPTPAPIASYRVLLEKDYNEFLPILDGMSNVTKSNLDYNFYSEGSFRLKNISRLNVDYEVNSNYKANWKTMVPLMERKALRLKSDKRDEIEKLIFKNGRPENESERFIAVENFFKARQFEYTLNPPAYNSLEDFILYGKAGYCSHFAAAFAYMARVAELPSRIISGYQGGEFNPFDQTIIVREQDAHAWVEIYFKDKGWIKYDPTSVVAPGRIQMGALAYHDQLEPYLNLYYYKLPKSLLRFKNVERSLLWLDSLNTSFSYNVFNFDKDRQQQLLNNYLPKNMSLGLLFSICLSLAMPILWMIFKWASRNKIDPREKRYMKFLKKMKHSGAVKEAHETATTFALKSSELFPDLAAYIQTETSAYINAFYRS